MTITSSASAEQLRNRATHLRALAQRLQTLCVLEVYRAAGTDTWVGPSPQRCDDALRGFSGSLRTSADGLAAEARRLNRLADEIEQRARLIGPN